MTMITFNYSDKIVINMNPMREGRNPNQYTLYCIEITLSFLYYIHRVDHITLSLLHQ